MTSALLHTHARTHAHADTPYEELISQRSTFHGSPEISGWAKLPFEGPVLQAVPRHGVGVILRTRGKLWSSDDGSHWHRLNVSFANHGMVLLDGGANAIAHARGVSILQCTSASTCNETLVAIIDDVSCGSTVTGGSMNASSGELVVGCSTGLFLGMIKPSASPPSLTREPSVKGPVAAASSWAGHIVAATRQPAAHQPRQAPRLHWRRPDGAWWWEWISEGDASTCTRAYSGGAVEAVPAAIAFDAAYGQAGGVWLGHARGLQAMDLQTGALQRFGAVTDGLPVANISAIAVTGGASGGNGGGVWLGTADAGVARRMPAHTSETGGAWRYYAGRRWLPGQSVSAITPLGAGSLLVATDGGLARWETQSWTLGAKARHYQAMVSPRHDRYGLIAECGLSSPANLSAYVPHDTDNDGLWTGMYTASQAFRYATTGDPAARAEALERYRALHFLFEVAACGPPRFPARSFARLGDTIYSGGADCSKSAPHCWRESTAKTGWLWKADTSSDELTGHMFTYPILHRLLKLNSSEAASVRGLVDGLVGGLVAHNLSLIDPSTGLPTTWGKFSVGWLNEVPSWSDDRGLRALEILSYLAAAEEVTGDRKYRSTAEALWVSHGYGRMMVNAKITDPCDDNHSDDEEAFLPLYTYMLAYEHLGRPREPEFEAALGRFCRVTRAEGSSLYLAICLLAEQSSGRALASDGGARMDALLDSLRGWPLELINWESRNSIRDDLRHKPSPLQGEASTPIPSRESSRMRWNADPYEMDDGGTGEREGEPGAFLLAYWLARYHKLIAAPS